MELKKETIFKPFYFNQIEVPCILHIQQENWLLLSLSSIQFFMHMDDSRFYVNRDIRLNENQTKQSQRIHDKMEQIKSVFNRIQEESKNELFAFLCMLTSMNNISESRLCVSDEAYRGFCIKYEITQNESLMLIPIKIEFLTILFCMDDDKCWMVIYQK